MRQIIKLLKQPHPAYDDLRIYFRTIGFIAATVFFILFIFRPFSLSVIDSDFKVFTRALTYAGAGFTMMSLSALWIIAFPKLFKQDSWTLGKEILILVYQMTTIAFTIWFVNLYLSKTNDNLQITSIWKSLWIAWTTGMLPYILVTLIRHLLLMKESLRNVEKVRLSIAMNSKNSEIRENKDNIFITTVNQKIPAISANEFLFLESRGNYLHLFCEKAGVINEYKSRNTVKEFRETNNHVSTLFHCHRAYLVNLTRIMHIEGNAAGYLLEMHPEIKKIPVSRSKINEFKQALNSIKTNPHNT